MLNITTKKDYQLFRDEILENYFEHLHLREGFRDVVYKDTEGHLTVGVGHKLTPEELEVYKEGDKWESSELTAQFHKDAEKAFVQAELQAGLCGYRWNADFVIGLASVCFQLGNSWNTIHKKTWKNMTDQKFLEAALEAQDSRWFKQTPVRVHDFQDCLVHMWRFTR